MSRWAWEEDKRDWSWSGGEDPTKQGRWSSSSQAWEGSKGAGKRKGEEEARGSGGADPTGGGADPRPRLYFPARQWTSEDKDRWGRQKANAPCFGV